MKRLLSAALAAASIAFAPIAAAQWQVPQYSIPIGLGSGTGFGSAAPGATGVPLVSQGAAANPAFGTAVVAGGGTGATSLTNHGVLLGQGTSPVAAVAPGAAGGLLQSNGAAADPSFATTLTGSYTFSSQLTVPLVIGGTGAGSSLTLQSTSGVGSSDSLIFKTGSQVTRWTIDTSGNLVSAGSGVQYVGFSSGNNALVLDATNGVGLVGTGNVSIQIDSNNDDTTRAFQVRKDAGTLGTGTLLFEVLENGQVAIGDSNVQQFRKFYVNHVDTSDDALIGHAAIEARQDYQPGINTAANPVGIYGTLWYNAPRTFTGDGAAVKGNAYTIAQSGAAAVNVTYLIGSYGRARHEAAGTVTNAVSFFADAAQNAGTGTITNAAGLYIIANTAATNNYGVLLTGEPAGGSIAATANNSVSMVSSGTGTTKLISAGGTITLAAAGTTSFPAAILPTVSDGAALGSTSFMWSDLFLASGAVINFNNGDVTATHSANTLAFAGGEYAFSGRVTATTTGATAPLVVNSDNNVYVTIAANQNTSQIGINFQPKDGGGSVQNAYFITSSTSFQIISPPNGTVQLGENNGSGGINEAVRLGSGQEVYFPGIGTTASAANAFLNSGSSPANQLLRSTSARKYKTDIRDLTEDEAERIVRGLRPVAYRSLASADDPAREYIGIVADEADLVDTRLVNYFDGVPDGFQYDRVIVPLLIIAKKYLAERDAR